MGPYPTFCAANERAKGIGSKKLRKELRCGIGGEGGVEGREKGKKLTEYRDEGRQTFPRQTQGGANGFLRGSVNILAQKPTLSIIIQG